MGQPDLTGIAPPGFDKTSVEARIDAGHDEGKLGATVSRSLPIDPDLSLTVQNSTSVKQSLASAAPVPPVVAATTTTPSATSSWGVDDTVRLSVDPLGTTFSAGAASSPGDPQWHNKLSVEQTLFGPLKLTTSLEDAGTPAPKRSISAGFKRTW